MKKWYSFDLVYCPVPFVISPWLSYKQSLDGSSKRLFQWLVHLKGSDNLKTIFKYETAKNQFSNLNLDLTLKKYSQIQTSKSFKIEIIILKKHVLF